MKHFILTITFFASAFTGLSAQDMNLTSDLVLSETLVISENTVITGNGFSIICSGCNPAIEVEGETELQLDNVRFPRVYEKWITVSSPGGRASWNSPKMTGFIEWSGPQ